MGKGAADSFSHTIRSEADHFEKIITVMNYVEAIYTDYDPVRDGIRHSDYFDDCTNSENQPVVDAAKRATKELTEMFGDYFQSGDEALLDAFCDKWFSVRMDCYDNYALCQSEHWLEVSMRDETHPYLECSQNLYRNAPLSVPLFCLVLGAGIAFYRKRREVMKKDV